MHNKFYVKIKNILKENLWFFISIIFIILIFNIEIGYVIETPGGFISLNDRISVEDGYSSSGELGMAYVSMTKGSIPFLLYSFINKDWDIIKKSDIMYDDETTKSANKREKIAQEESIDNAIINAFREANKSYTIGKQDIYVSYIADYADTSLKLLDIICDINKEAINSLDDLRRIVKSHKGDEVLDIGVIRDDNYIVVKSKVISLKDSSILGIMTMTDYDLETDPKVDVKVLSRESGPSGGLMTSLAIYNSLVSDDITKGKKIIGTGTIDNEGTVGAIGGVKYKLIGAVKKKSDVFICPKDNYEEAVSVANDRGYIIKIIGVSTFDEALRELEKL